MESFTITTATRYQDGEDAIIMATIDGVTMSVPLDENNRHYAEILRQVAAGTLVIQDAE